ncbi:MAG TPA: MqnA/MqnD/SBP family protein [Phycisphaerales bacterium]|nr:MqnA/MqnD/SBP family protein [Phycisphaerales bacterium]
MPDPHEPHDARPVLTLAHSPDPDDAFMWWPITGKVRPDGMQVSPPVIDTGRFRFAALPADIEVLNRRAAEVGDLDITALSFRAWGNVRERYVVTRTGSSFGEGFGPKVVRRADSEKVHCVNCLRGGDVRIAIPGRRTTAFLVLGMLLGRERVAKEGKVVEMPFERIIAAVAEGEVDAGLVIHEGQLLYEQAGLKLVVDLGKWWQEQTGLPLPLGCNAVRRDLDARFGAGSVDEVSRTLRRSVDYALEHRRESLEYTLPFALANAAKPGGSGAPTLERVDEYVKMYVNRWTVDMGPEGLAAVQRLFDEGARAGLCDTVAVDAI